MQGVISCLENPMGGGAWQAAVHGVAKNQTRLSDFTFTFHFHALEKEMAPPLQYSCLENPRDGGAWLAYIYGIAQSWTPLKRLSSSSRKPGKPADSISPFSPSLTQITSISKESACTHSWHPRFWGCHRRHRSPDCLTSQLTGFSFSGPQDYSTQRRSS